MKYGIITHYDVHNHGALLQLNALCRVLERDFGVQAQALQFDKNYDFLGHELKAKYEVGARSIKMYIKILMERGMKWTLYNYKKRRTLEQYKKDKNLVGSFYAGCENLDGVIIGSDEVFALHTGVTPAFFGFALPSKKVFSYAGCFGPTTIADIDALNCRQFVEAGLKNLSGISMRDINSCDIGEALTGKRPELVCDPVILYGYEEELSQSKRPMKDRYLVVYAYDKRMNETGEVNAILDFANKNGLKVVSPGFFHPWVDSNVNVSPEELLAWFKYADLVVTDTFHGCVLSLISGRDMAVRLRDNSNKLLNLMNEYGISNRLIGDDWKLDELFANRVDYHAVNKEIDKRRESSMNFLKKMIIQTV